MMSGTGVSSGLRTKGLKSTRDLESTVKPDVQEADIGR